MDNINLNSFRMEDHPHSVGDTSVVDIIIGEVIIIIMTIHRPFVLILRG